MEALEEITVDRDECSGCHRRAESNEIFKCCSKCKEVYYCSRECQVSNWSVHKVRCKQRVKLKELALQNRQQREFNLLQEWKRQVKNGGILAYMIMKFFGWNIVSRLEELQSVVNLRLVFDYNKRNFVPDSEPSIVCIDDVGPEKGQEVRQIYASYPPLSSNQCKMLVFIMIEGMPIWSGMPFIAERPTSKALESGSWREMQELLNSVKLHSSKFALWNQLGQQNLNSSINTSGIRNSTHFHTFLTNALWIESKKSRHKTHVITIDMSLGYGLGEIKSLDSYRVRPLTEVSSLLQEAGILTPEVQQWLDLEHNPELLQSRKQYPNNVLVPVLFYCSRTKVGFTSPNMMEVSPNRNKNNSTKQCDKKANAAFQKLQKVRFPSVHSPELH
jgi:hypothetical protein